jgi:hypothetical protein
MQGEIVTTYLSEGEQAYRFSSSIRMGSANYVKEIRDLKGISEHYCLRD